MNESREINGEVCALRIHRRMLSIEMTKAKHYLPLGATDSENLYSKNPFPLFDF